MQPPQRLQVDARYAHLPALHSLAMHTIASCSSAASLLAVGEWRESDDELLERWAAMTQQLLEQAQELAAMGQLWSQRAKAARRLAIMEARQVPPASTSCDEWRASVPPLWCSAPPIYTGSWAMAATVAQRPGAVELTVPSLGSDATRPGPLPTPPSFARRGPARADFACQTANLASSPWWHHAPAELRAPPPPPPAPRT